ncbi:MAG: M1 family peptidase, partial [Flavobacteriales bacterium]
LDWFWRGWFFTTDHVDISIDNVNWYKVNTKDPKKEKNQLKAKKTKKEKFISNKRNKEIEKKVERETDLKDFYNKHDPFEVTVLDEKEYEKYINKLSDKEKKLLNKDHNYYEVHFSNKGGLVMPLILEFKFKDGTKEMKHIPAEIWKMNSENISKIFHFKKEVKQINLDPNLETADVDMHNNHWPRKAKPSKFELYKRRNYGEKENKMQRYERAKEMEKEKKGN